jgi:hypothetical protein
LLIGLQELTAGKVSNQVTEKRILLSPTEKRSGHP